MIVIFMITFWVFRIVVTYCYAKGIQFMVTPLDYYAEIASLFITFICIILVFKEQKVGGILYFIIHILYYGANFILAIEGIFSMVTSDTMTMTVQFMVAIVGIALGVAAFINCLSYDLKSTTDNKTEWFFHSKVERAKDSRDDTNQYRIL